MRKPLRLTLATVALLLASATAAPAQYLYWLDTNWGAPMLRRMHVYQITVYNEIALPPGTLPEGLAYSPSDGHLVFGESAFTGAAIQQTTPTLVPAVPVATGQSCVRGVAAHPVSGDLYWTTSNLVTGSQVWHSDAAGASAQALLTFGTAVNLRGIAVDEAAGTLYFADFDQNLILRSNLDGTALTVFQTLGAGAGPYGLAFDSGTRRLYWCEYTAARVRWALADGGAPVTLYGSLANPTYVELIPDASAPGGAFLVWSEAGTGAQRIALGLLDGSGVLPTVLTMGTFGGLAYVGGNALAVGPGIFAQPEFALAPVSPNPATAASVVQFSLPAEMRARLTLVDVQGRRVCTLADGTLPAGSHSIALATAWAANRPRAGVYFLRLEAGGRQVTHKLVLAD